MWEVLLRDTWFTSSENDLKRYTRFINQRIGRPKDFGDCLHHILPVCEYPEYKNLRTFEWNGVRLTDREHFVAHIMLYKLFKTHALGTALNMMCNFEPRKLTYSKIYMESRRSFKARIGQTNKGPKDLTEEQRRRIGEKLVGKVLVYHIDEPSTLFKVDCNDLKNNSSLRFHKTGSKQKPETIEKIRLNSTLGRVSYTDGERMVFCKEGEVTPEGWHKGGVSTSKDYLKGTYWFHNPVTGEHSRSHTAPEGFIPGRAGDSHLNAFKAVNSKIKVFDFIEHTFKLVEVVDKEKHLPAPGVSLDKVVLYIYDGFIFSGFTLLELYAKERGVYFDRGETEVKPLKLKSYKRPSSIFKIENEGKTYKELGLEIVHHSEFSVEDYRGVKGYWND